MTIADRVKAVRDQIGDAALRSGRRPEDITLVAAAKMNTAEKVRAAIEAGVDAVGENRVQEMLQKNDEGAYRGVPLHFIGHLQTNKVRQVVGVCRMIESVDSEELLALIGKKAQSLNMTQDILIEVNIGRELSKSGVLPERLDDILAAASKTPGISVRGLMAVPPIYGNFSGSDHYFEEMYKLFVDIRVKKYDNISMHYLSMGMSDTFTAAIHAGANMVRVGSAIFGERFYP
ncbi:YggS family pyridoxal phosphate-dependent enzyme [Oscillospiraceae bacterium CM]|nr:YggS family pyridoxal phosphate-dependent enzyme [Oscillospiraceae bacterium CM]